MLGKLFRKLRREQSGSILDKPFRRIDYMSEGDILHCQSERVHEILTLLKYGHESDLPGFAEIDRSDPEALARWTADFVMAPLVEDLRPQLIAIADDIKQERVGSEQRG